MNYTRVTAHFDTKENAKKAEASLLKKDFLGHFTNVKAINKKVSVENDTDGLIGLSDSQARLILVESRDNVLQWLDGCKGLSYTVLVSR